MRMESANPGPLVTAAGAVRTTRSIYKGIAVRDTGGGAAVFRLWDNATAATGNVIDIVQVPAAAGGTNVSRLHPGGIDCANGIWLEQVSGGAFEAVIFQG